MQSYHIVGLAEDTAEEVRRTLRSPEYGHPAVRETASGTGPCRVCLTRFAVGADQRILFTFRAIVDAADVGAPGPIVIHTHRCAQYRGTLFPPDLHSLPLVLEGRAAGNRVPHARSVPGSEADAALSELFQHPEVEYVHIRRADAGCYIARADRGAVPVG